ncbi:DUF2326 domain-containing protein [Bacillus sp. Bva_UNVM-123]|uniref:DUF2326 domain-containing protein n=1 Tax=Bacillus sp. Bva_UNVM-123 TaxID=2829798 RepID=UPI00391F5A86
MIEKIYSTLETFDEIKLHNGLNILLADITKKSTDKDTRNGLGKTTFVEIIHFLFGGSCTNNSVFKLPIFKNHFFIMDYVLDDTKFTVKRRGFDSNYVYVCCEKGSKYDSFFGEQERKMKVADWNEFLGESLFNLDNKDSRINENIKFRTLFPYFARKAADGGFLESSRYYKNQKVFPTQIALTYLLGLDTKLSIDQKNLEEKKKEIADLKKVLKTDAYQEIVNEGINLDTEITILEEKANNLKRELESFQVHPKYKEIEVEASSYAKQISDLSNKNFIDRQIITELKEASKNEENISDINIKDLYEEVKVKLPDALVKTFSDSKIFHERLISNRKNYLSSELNKYEKLVKEREGLIKNLSIEQSKRMEVLNTHGALEQYSLLQTELNELVNRIITYKNQQKLIISIREEEANLKIAEQKLIIEITKSLEEHTKTKQKAILLVEEASKSLYNSAAQLNIGQTKTGRYDIEMVSRNQGSTGINSMLIYCFDMMMIQMSTYLGRKMDVLIHDSALYDPVDERQIAEALRFGKEKSLEKEFQYIITLNSDDLPESVAIEVKNNILSKVLTDSDESGSLLGVYY